jgi:anti-sigma B factor antagonist
MASGTPPHLDEFARIPALEDGAGSVVLRVAGAVDVYSAERLRAALEPVLTDGPTRVLLECSDLDFIDSTGLGVLIAAAKRLRACEGTLALSALPERLMKIFRITGLTRVFAFHDTPGMPRASR